MTNLQLLMSKLYFRASELSWDQKTIDWNGLHNQTVTRGFEDLALWSSSASPPKPINTSILHPELFSPSKFNSSYFAVSLDLAGTGSEFFSSSSKWAKLLLSGRETEGKPWDLTRESQCGTLVSPGTKAFFKWFWL